MSTINNLTRYEQDGKALTVRLIHKELQNPEVAADLSTYKIVTYTEEVNSPYDKYDQKYALIVPPLESGFLPILVTEAEIIYLNAHGADVLRRCTGYDLPMIYEAIIEARPLAHQYRVRYHGGGYDPSVPCNIIVHGTEVSTVRDTQTVNVDEFFARLRDGNQKAIKIRERGNITFGTHTGGNPFQRAARRIAEEIAGNASSNK